MWLVGLCFARAAIRIDEDDVNGTRILLHTRDCG